MKSAPNEPSDYEKALQRALDEGRVLLVGGAIFDTPIGHEAMFAEMRAADRRAMEKSGPPPKGWRAPKTEDERLRAAHDFIAGIKSRANFADSLAKGSVTEQVRAPDLAETPSPRGNTALAQSADDPGRLTDLGLVERAAAAICEREPVSRLQALDRLADDFNFGSWMELVEAFESGEPIPMPDVTNDHQSQGVVVPILCRQLSRLGETALPFPVRNGLQPTSGAACLNADSTACLLESASQSEFSPVTEWQSEC